MAGLGFDIGSHTLTHANLAELPRDQARREIVDSRKEIEDEVGRPVRWFAYPFGGRDQFRADLLPLVHEGGYEACFSGYGGFLYQGLVGEILSREAVPFFHSTVNLELHLRGCLHWLYAVKRRAGLLGATAEALTPVSAACKAPVVR
jgi:peptidoglycan/xylan/chitin deacetylase (PgdA/CDA1 family)